MEANNKILATLAMEDLLGMKKDNGLKGYTAELVSLILELNCGELDKV